MSLHALAGHMAAKGRGPDSMLVHMTPDEVQSLQTMARAQGGEVTINPETGLPEAGFLSDTLKALAPVALGAVLGPAGFGLSAGMAAAATGGITALATGSLSRGLMAGMGAYGGAGLAEGLAGMGSSAVGADALAAANASADPIASLTAAKDAATAAGTAAPSGLSAVSEGAKRAFTSAEGFKELGNTMGGMGKLASTGLAAISPIMADQGVQTTTPKQDTGYIRQKKFNPYTQQYIDLEPVKASEWGSRRFSDYAGGGIVALADGGMPGYFAANPDVAAAYQQNSYGMSPDQFAQTHFQNYGQAEQRAAPSAATTTSVSDADIRNWLGSQSNLSDIAIQQAMDKYGVSADQMATATGIGLPEVQNRYALAQDINAFSQTSPNLTDLQWAQYAVSRDPGAFDPASMAELSRATGVPLDQVMQRYSAVQHGLLVPEGGEDAAKKYLSENKDVFDWTRSQEGRDYMRTHALTADDIAWTHFNRYGIGEGRQWGVKTTTPPVVPDNTGLGNVPGGSGGGNTVRNPDGTITTSPNIPGRPAGGFTGMGQVKDVYTQGGGSLGQSNLFVPKTLDEMYARYGNTGGSQQAYDYLMGKGSADIKKPVTQSGELMLPYAQAVLGQELAAASGPSTQKYLFDPKTRRYILNPAYVDPNAPKEVAPKAPAVTNNSMATEAANGGVMHMALGGLGALAGGGATSQYNLGSYSDGGRLLRGPGDGVSDSIPATIGDKQPARLADGEFVVPARIVSELGNGSTEAGARKLYAMMDRVQKARRKTTGKNRVAANTRADKYLPA